MKINQAIALWPIVPFGGEDDEDDSGAGNSNDGGNASGNQAGQGAQSGTGKGNKGTGKGTGASGSASDDDSDDDEFDGFSVAELKRLARDNAQKAKDAEAERKAAQEIIDAEERKKNDDLTNLTKDLEKERQTVQTLRATVVKQAIEASIRDDKRYEWHDVEMVATVAGQINPDISVSDDGKVEGLKATLPKVAKEHPFLIKTDKSGGNKNDERQQNNGNFGATGFQPGQGGTSGGNGNEINAAALAENYPALAGRV